MFSNDELLSQLASVRPKAARNKIDRRVVGMAESRTSGAIARHPTLDGGRTGGEGPLMIKENQI